LSVSLRYLFDLGGSVNLRHLSVFHGVAKAGSVNAAARLLHTSQPAVSRELRTLEERLGAPLFDRLPRGMRLTEAGQLLLSYAERIFGLEEAAERLSTAAIRK
jgi:DNA-binding transcriptional LysR family regulator